MLEPHDIFRIIILLIASIVISLLFSIIGKNRKIGMWKSAIFSLLSIMICIACIYFVQFIGFRDMFTTLVFLISGPAIGVIITLLSPRKIGIVDNKVVGIENELTRLKKMREDNLITDEEYQQLKNKVINKF